ncbi:hypothetical protein COCON_G00113660 [Conger conger]|uniref:SAP domain-containing protein n=1 Tax=Conger conger TaxID=82655 RepID=A0A9Q1DFM8_CONCO|nr:hypothetical protein COCON_G00113660 [Conger conger]
MADLEDVTLDGKPLHSLRVADLKSALEQRGLPKSGQKNALIKRLKGALMLEDLQRISTPHVGLQPNSQVGEEMSQNSFIKQYLAKQQELLRQRLEREAGPGSLAGPDNDDDVTESGDITSCTPVEQCSGGPTPHLAEEVMSSEGASDDDEDSDEEWGVVRAAEPPGTGPALPRPAVSTETHGPASQEGGAEGGVSPGHAHTLQDTPPSPSCLPSSPPTEAGLLSGVGTHVAMEREVGVVPLLPPSSPPDEGDPARTVPSSSSSSSSSPSSDSDSSSLGAQSRRREEQQQEEGGASHRKEPCPERGNEDGMKRHQTSRVNNVAAQKPQSASKPFHLNAFHCCRAGLILGELSGPELVFGSMLCENNTSGEVVQAGSDSVMEAEACSNRQGPAEESPTAQAYSTQKTSLTSCTPTPGRGLVTVGTMGPAAPPTGTLEGAESVAQEGVEPEAPASRKRRWSSSTLAAAKQQQHQPCDGIGTEEAQGQAVGPEAPGSREAVVELHPEESRLSGGEEDQAGGSKIQRTAPQVVSAGMVSSREWRKEEEDEAGG